MKTENNSIVEQKHWDMGYLIITTPNFAGIFQRILHRFTDKNNYKLHVIDSMNPDKWENILGKNYEILYKGYFGGFMFWVEKQQRNIIQKLILKLYSALYRILAKFSIPDNRIYSPFCGLIVKKIA